MTSKSGKNKKKIGTRGAAEVVSCRQCGRVSWDARLECGGPGLNPPPSSPATYWIFSWLLSIDRGCTLHIAISHYYYISGVTHPNAMNSYGTVGR